MKKFSTPPNFPKMFYKSAFSRLQKSFIDSIPSHCACFIM